MKNLLLALIASAVALSFTACEPTTNVKWIAASDPTTNASPGPTDGIYDIKWIDNGIEDTTWSDHLTDANIPTDSKTVGTLNGTGECFADGVGAIIDVSDSSPGVKSASSYGSVQLEEGADVTLIINSTQAVK
jgi:hypothetical protein